MMAMNGIQAVQIRSTTDRELDLCSNKQIKKQASINNQEARSQEHQINHMIHYKR